MNIPKINLLSPRNLSRGSHLPSLKTARDVVAEVIDSFERHSEAILAGDGKSEDLDPAKNRVLVMGSGRTDLSPSILNAPTAVLALSKSGVVNDFGVINEQGETLSYQRKHITRSQYRHIYSDISHGRVRRVTLESDGSVYRVEDRIADNIIFDNSPF